METIHELVQRILREGSTPGTLFVLLSQWKGTAEIDHFIRECARAITLHPRDIRLRCLLAEACLRDGRFSLAESEVDQSIGEIEGLIPLYRMKAEICLRGRRNEEARRAIEIYLAHRPDDEEALALLKELKSPPEVALEESPAHAAPVEQDLTSLPEAGSGDQEDGIVPEIATPTLAEVYFSQGQIHEAVATYEKVLARNPLVEPFRKRLDELKAMLDSPAPSGAVPDKEDAADRRTEKLIAVLDEWQSRLRELSKGPAPL